MPVADAYVRADFARRSFGRRASLRLDAAPTARAYLFFGRALPGSGDVHRAILRVYAVDNSAAGFRVRVARGSWSEQSLTYANAPRPSRANVASGPVRRGWTRVDITSFVRRYGTQATWVLTTGSQRGLAISSRESRAKPQLLVSTKPTPSPKPPPPPPGGVVFAGAGDIAYGGSEDEDTAKILDALNPDVVFTVGDNAYDSGSASDYTKYYEPTWGRHKAKTRPSPGNHDYRTSNASGYFAYFGAAAGDPAKGYYSYEAGAWHVVVLNTSGDGVCAKVACGAGSAQERWLRADLAASTKQCTVAYWHHPRFSRGQHGDNAGVGALWQALYDDGAELILQGHDHNYQRWKLLDPSGGVDTAKGIRSFVVGTGGKNAYTLGTHRNLEASQTGTPGVLKLTLRAGNYDWQFVSVAGKTYTDAGSGNCH